MIGIGLSGVSGMTTGTLPFGLRPGQSLRSGCLRWIPDARSAGYGASHGGFLHLMTFRVRVLSC